MANRKKLEYESQLQSMESQVCDHIGKSSEVIVLHESESSMQSKQERDVLIPSESYSGDSTNQSLGTNSSNLSFSGYEVTSADDETQIKTNESIHIPSKKNLIIPGANRGRVENNRQAKFLIANSPFDSFKESEKGVTKIIENGQSNLSNVELNEKLYLDEKLTIRDEYHVSQRYPLILLV